MRGRRYLSTPDWWILANLTLQTIGVRVEHLIVFFCHSSLGFHDSLFSSWEVATNSSSTRFLFSNFTGSFGVGLSRLLWGKCHVQLLVAVSIKGICGRNKTPWILWVGRNLFFVCSCLILPFQLPKRNKKQTKRGNVVQEQTSPPRKKQQPRCSQRFGFLFFSRSFQGAKHIRVESVAFLDFQWLHVSKLTRDPPPKSKIIIIIYQTICVYIRPNYIKLYYFTTPCILFHNPLK